MKNKLLIPALLAGSLALNWARAAAGAEPVTGARSGNPLFPGWYADPESAIFGKEYSIDHMYFDPAGRIVPIKITKEGVERRVLE